MCESELEQTYQLKEETSGSISLSFSLFPKLLVGALFPKKIMTIKSNEEYV